MELFRVIEYKGKIYKTIPFNLDSIKKSKLVFSNQGVEEVISIKDNEIITDKAEYDINGQFHPACKSSSDLKNVLVEYDYLNEAFIILLSNGYTISKNNNKWKV